MTARRGRLPAGTGLHARPAADLVAAIVASGQPVRVGRPGSEGVDGRSVLRVLGLGIHGGEEVELSIDGDSGDALLAELLALLGCDQPEGVLQGIGAAPGAAVGPVARMAGRPLLPAAGDPQPGDAARAIAALDEVAAELRGRAGRAPASAAAVLEAGAWIAEDPSLRADVERLVHDGLDAPHAIAAAAAPFREAIAAAGGALAQRADDVGDVRDRAIAICLGLPLPGVPAPGHPFVLVAADLAPADTALLDPDQVLAIVTEGGGPTGHTAILARELGIAAVVGCAAARSLAEGEVVAVFGDDGRVIREPGSEHVAAARRPRRTAATAGTAATADGHRVALLANLGAPGRAPAARQAGAEGIGLLRTEFCFEGRSVPPSVAEQVAAYREVTRAFPGARVVIRLLDAGADKPLPYLTSVDEPNPALGVRGLRALRAAPELLDAQLAAIAEVAGDGDADVWVMAPMVATAAEAAWFAEHARAAGIPAVGVMIEVPAAALTAGAILAEVDFASIGTNDLAQYTFAADRGLAALSGLQDPRQPALLRLIASTCEAGRAAGRPVGICGEAAADPELAPVLVGLGADSLSMAAASIGTVRERLAAITLADCREAAERALAGG
jgi:phosphotransferase system enzyme I (PtsI)